MSSLGAPLCFFQRYDHQAPRELHLWALAYLTTLSVCQTCLVLSPREQCAKLYAAAIDSYRVTLANSYSSQIPAGPLGMVLIYPHTDTHRPRDKLWALENASAIHPILNSNQGHGAGCYISYCVPTPARAYNLKVNSMTTKELRIEQWSLSQQWTPLHPITTSCTTNRTSRPTVTVLPVGLIPPNIYIPYRTMALMTNHGPPSN